ncbi:molybdopterin cofactor-binding domain-containing protein [Providencia huaxiensis]|uniref:xanthine dehydrogenase family protein molybdopterin-binding subunit n=1 Tax=Providencia TaxID=586 RepID=UPI001BD3F549|nr:xanthine dehydrogenase family protein molybdopterin-binding subunit [Providencia rettgeri]
MSKSNVELSRRHFLKCAVIAGISVYLAPLYSRAFDVLFEEKILQSPDWNPVDKQIKFRIDGFAKVQGEKVFARDIRARDIPHWPKQQGHAFLLRVTQADKIYQGFNLDRLKNGLMPDRIVTASDLEKDGVAFPEFYGDDLLLPEGKTPAYLGQAVALLIYHDFAKFRFAKETLKFRDDVIQYGAVTGPLERDPWGTYRGVRIGNENPYEPDIYSSLKDMPISPIGMKKHLPVWPEGREGGKLDQQGMLYADELAKQLENPPEDWLVLKRKYFSQSIDTAALEPDNANGWYDAKTQSFHLVIPTQSPQEVAESLPEMLAKSHFPVKQIFLHPCFTVGYGSKDHTPFPYYGAMATLYGDGVPIRLANDRYEQFQSTIKRHAFDMDYTLAVNKKTHKIEALSASFIGDGGGRCNFTPSVVMVGATGAQAIYYIPRSDLSAVGIASRAVDAGSARGYGTLQAMAATDMLMEEAAKLLKADPIEFRLKNIIKSGMKNTQGAIPGGAIRADEVLTRCAAHPMWTDRAKRKADFEAKNSGKLFGTGISCVQKDFGTGAESSFARVELTPEGKIAIYHSGAEIGTGMSTSQSVVCAKWLGKPAEQAHFSVVDWSILPMISTGNPFAMSQDEQNHLAQNPLWTPNYCSPASASNSAYYFTHSTEAAARLIFEHGLWPAAMSIWQEGIGGGQAAPLVVRREDARWVAEGLTADGLEVLSLPRLIERTFAMGGVTGAVCHVFNRWQWAEADFPIQGETRRLPIDGLSLRFADKEYQVCHREKAYYPDTQRNNAGVTYYSAVATVSELSIDKATGQVELLNHHSVVECGNLIVPQLVSGQIQGGLAMGIGHALHEYLPLYEDGPGNGTWNFNRYHLPLASDVAVWQQTNEVLPGLSDTDPPKGVAEVVMIPVVSSIVNAIADATGHHFLHLPVRAKDILEVIS